MSLIRIFFAAFVTCILAAAAPAQQNKSLIDDYIVREAETFEKTLQSTWSTKGKDAKAWRAEGLKANQAKDPRAATGYFASSALLDKNNGDNWLDLARAYLAIETEQYNEKTTFARNAGSAAYIASTRLSRGAGIRRERSRLWPKAGAELDNGGRRCACIKRASRLSPMPMCKRLMTRRSTSTAFVCSITRATMSSNSPRICVQFSEEIAKGRVDFTNFVTVNNEKPAGVRVQGSQLCVEDLLHGKRYDVKIRSGIPSTEDDLLPKPVELTVYIRDRKPAVRFSSRNYVLPRTGQQGIPVVSINTKLVKATIYRIGDRRLAAEVLDGDFQKPLESYQLNQIADQKGEKLWSGEMPVAPKLNEEVTTAFPIDELLPNLKPGLYIIAANTAEEGANSAEDEYSTKATQWFVVSDLGLTGFSGRDGVHVFARSLATAEPIAGAEIRLVARNNEVLGTAKTDNEGVANFEAGLARGTGGLSPALIVARGADADYGFLDVTKQAFDLSDRGVGGRASPGSLDAMIFTERGVYRPGETVFVTALLRDAAANAVPGTPLILKLTRPDGMENRRETLADQGNGGRSWQITLPQTAATGSWRLSAYVDPKGPSLFDKSFLVEDYVPERLEMKLTASNPVIIYGDPWRGQFVGALSIRRSGLQSRP